MMLMLISFHSVFNCISMMLISFHSVSTWSIDDVDIGPLSV